MKLDYKILWFDDQPRFVEGVADTLNDFLDEQGFNLKIDWQQNDSNLKDLSDTQAFNNYDLILVDYDMGTKSAHGDELAKVIRDTFYTDIIFYSGKDKVELKKLIANKPVDGIYCSNRKVNFVHDITEVIKTGIRIFQHPNALRGMVMAETADFDNIITNCLLTYATKLTPEKVTEYLTEIYQWVDEKSQENIKQFGKRIDPEKPSSFLNHRAFQAKHKLIHLIKSIEHIESIKPFIEELKAYDSEVIEPRNKLAHVKLEEKGGKLTLVGSDFEFTPDALIALRKTLLKHGQNFENIIAQLG